MTLFSLRLSLFPFYQLRIEVQISLTNVSLDLLSDDRVRWSLHDGLSVVGPFNPSFRSRFVNLDSKRYRDLNYAFYQIMYWKHRLPLFLFYVYTQKLKKFPEQKIKILCSHIFYLVIEKLFFQYKMKILYYMWRTNSLLF